MTYTKASDYFSKNRHTWLITGVAGFIGSNLLEHLLKLNQKVKGIDNFSNGFKYNLEAVQGLVSAEQWNNFDFEEADMRDLEACRRACTDVEFILQEGALGSVPRSIRDPITTNASNIDGFLNMLVAAKDTPSLKRFIYAGSSSTYGDHTALPKVEDRIGKPLSPYAVTKYVNELYAHVFFKTYGLPVIGLRYFNVFGQRQNPAGAYAAVIPKWIAAFIENQTITINGDGETTRDFSHVDNIVQANILAAYCEKDDVSGQVYNIAYGGRASLNTLYNEIKSILADRYPHLKNHTPVYADFRPGDVRDSQADTSKAQKDLGYSPQVSLREGLEKTIPNFLHTQQIKSQII